MRVLLKLLVIFSAVLAMIDPCGAVMVDPPIRLDQMVKKSNVVFKAKVVISRPIKEEWFEKQSGFKPYGTEMHVISVMKGDVSIRNVIFQHYRIARGPASFGTYWPHHYEFESGKSYIVFAQKTDKNNVFRQLWKTPRIKGDEGVIFVGDDQPVTEGVSIKEVIWSELNKLLQARNYEEIRYAIRQLNHMSRGRYDDRGVTDFDRSRVVEAIRPFVLSTDTGIVKETIGALGVASPYLNDEPLRWLATAGSGSLGGISQRLQRDVVNTDARECWKDLAKVVEGDAPTDIRDMAVLALGRACIPETLDCILRWTSDTAPLVRQAAVVLTADFPIEKVSQLLTDRSQDGASEVRVGVAWAVGFGQFHQLLPLLDQLLDDQNAEVREAAALSLLSFTPATAESILKKHLEDPDYKSVFINALAKKDPEPYLDALVEIIKTRPRSRVDCRSTDVVSWEILYDYVLGQKPEVLQSGKLDRYLDKMEGAEFYGSSLPRNLYAFYLERGMFARARVFRGRCNKMVVDSSIFDSVDMEYGLS